MSPLSSFFPLVESGHSRLRPRDSEEKTLVRRLPKLLAAHLMKPKEARLKKEPEDPALEMALLFR